MHCQPQEKNVKVIHILANDTSDTVMYGITCGKENMFNAFVNRELADGAYHLTSLS